VLLAVDTTVRAVSIGAARADTAPHVGCGKDEGEIMAECECSDEYGPCEAHGTVLAQRVGASSRSADELTRVYLEDARDIDGAILSPYGVGVLARVSDPAAWEGSWLADPALADELRDVAWQVEAALDAWTVWDDGYVIVRPSTDCPLVGE
jgi:hypothetical protein